MAVTPKGIYYPSTPSAQADLLTDLEDMAESIDTALDNVVIPVDSALSPTSENPVQNKVITANIEDLEAENAELKNIIDQIVPTTTQEGTDITLQNTLDAKLKNLTPKGNTSQETYNGDNLVNYDGTQVNLVKSTNRTITITPTNFPLTLPAGTYTIALPDLVMTNNSYNFAIQLFITGGTYIATGYNNSVKSYTFTLSEEKTFTKLYCFVSNSDNDNATATFSKIMLNTGNTAKEWEKFVGGTASPNPDFPQNVKVVTGNNNIVISNKNLLASVMELGTLNNNSGVIAGSTDTIRTKDFVSVSPSTQYTISLNLAYHIFTYYYDKSQNFIGYVNGNTENIISNYTFITPDNCYYVKFRTSASNVENDLTSKWQLEKGSSATSYIEHQGATYPLSLGSIELAKIGTYQDYITGTIDNWKIVKNIRKVVLTGGSSEAWNIYFSTNGIYSCSQGGAIISGFGTINGICDKFIAKTRNEIRLHLDEVDLCCAFAGSELVIAYKEKTTLNNFKAWLGNNNVTCYYILATPTEETITDTTLISQLNAIYNARSYSGQTNITSTYANEQMIISATALTQMGV